MVSKLTNIFSNIGAVISTANKYNVLDVQYVLNHLNFGRVDAESDNKFGNCFIGTDMLKNILLPEHSLIVGAKGAGKSAIFRLLCDDIQKVRPFLPRSYQEIFCVPAYGIQSEDNIPTSELIELNPNSVNDFRNFWLVYLGLKTALELIKNEKLQGIIAKSNNKAVKEKNAALHRLLVDVGVMVENNTISKLAKKFTSWIKSSHDLKPSVDLDSARTMTYDFRHKTGMSIIALFDTIDFILTETKCLAWIMLDKLDLLFIGDYERLKAAITGAVQLLVEYSSRFKSIHFKIFLRTDIYRQLLIVNKSHLISYTKDMHWRKPLLLKLLVSRAVDDPIVREYCEALTGEKIDVSNVIVGSDDYVKKIFYAIFQPTMASGDSNLTKAPFTHEWILKRMVDGMGNSYPRELIHLGNLSVKKQKEFNRAAGRHTSTRLISPRAIKESFDEVSIYRCDTYLYSEFPHLAKHFNVFRGSDSTTFHREELYMLFEPLNPKGDEAIRAVYDTGLLIPLGKNVDSSLKFKIPPLYKPGLGIINRRTKTSIIDKFVNPEKEEMK